MNGFVKANEIGTGGAMTLPGRYYTSLDVFALEQERIFRRHWLCAGRLEQLAAPGDYLVRDVGRDSVIVVRDEAGTIRGYHNVCRHRGTRLCDLAHGHAGHSIRCPYHAWTYNLQGRLLAAPTMDESCDFEKRDYPLHDVETATWEVLVFVCLGEPHEEFERMYAPLAGRVSRYELAGLHCVREIQYDVQANWKLIFEKAGTICSARRSFRRV